MSACVVWIDSENATVFHLSETVGAQKKHVYSHTDNPIGAHHDNHKKNNAEHFFHKVALSIEQPIDELLIFGSGLAKNHFKTHLDKHHHHDLFQKLVGVEPLDHLTDNQILQASRVYFKKFNRYHNLDKLNNQSIG